MLTCSSSTPRRFLPLGTSFCSRKHQRVTVQKRSYQVISTGPIPVWLTPALLHSSSYSRNWHVCLQQQKQTQFEKSQNPLRCTTSSFDSKGFLSAAKSSGVAGLNRLHQVINTLRTGCSEPLSLFIVAAPHPFYLAASHSFGSHLYVLVA